MFQFLNKHRFWIFMTLAAVVQSVDCLPGIEARPLVDGGLGLIFFMLACMSVPDTLGKEKKQP